MMRQYLNWKSYLILSALLIVAATLYYTNELASHLAQEEQKNVRRLAEAIKILSNGKENQDFSFIISYIDSNSTIPLIIAKEGDVILSYKNIDTNHVGNVPDFLKRTLADYKQQHAPIVSDYGTGKNYIYYGESHLVTQLRYFPYVQLTIILLFLIVVLVALGIAHRSIQNQVWVGLSKETAHQLGTPLSSIAGWLELLKDREENAEAVSEMEKDMARLQLVADRFSKVGSTPQLEEENLIDRLSQMVDYMQRRAPSKVSIQLESNDDDVPVNISGPLFDWVIENLMRNALDAMDGKGSIKLLVTNTPQQVWIDISDTGKGIAKHQIRKVFNPGFTTKKRGWGLGLSLSMRIIKDYHHGSLFVKSSEVGKGTTFRIILRR